MNVEKVINNNVIMAVDDSGRELVLMGKGVGFQAKAGQPILEDRVEKKVYYGYTSGYRKVRRVSEDYSIGTLGCLHGNN